MAVPLGWYACLLTAPVLLACAGSVAAACLQSVGRFSSIEGQVEVLDDAGGGWHPAQPDAPLCEGDSIRVGVPGRAAVLLAGNTVLRLDQDTSLRLVDIRDDSEQVSWIDISRGAVYSFSRQPRKLKVIARRLMALIKGTEFQVRVEGDRSLLAVMEGSVEVSSEQGSALVRAGREVLVEPGQAPREYPLIRPRDAVQWSIYYPPVLDFQARAEDPPGLGRALSLARRGEPASALRVLETVPPSDRDARYWLQRAALRVSLGRIAEAEADLRAIAPTKGTDAAQALALRAIIALAQGDAGRAMAEAQRSQRMGGGVAAEIALSYGRQAAFQVRAAREGLLAAAERYPSDGMVWARLAELHLMSGETADAGEAAERAVDLSPRLGRASMSLGFCHLARFRYDEAAAAFRRAMSLDSAEPMAHLGLGLAHIARGRLAEGRAEIEVAVALDSNSALLRTYLGKAYFTEKRAPLDRTQFGLAKALDPRDPTAFLYDGIRSQTENRPVEALRDLQASVELNDNRAVYRSRLLLDKDRASRSTSLARAYRDLGFTELGQREAGRSLDLEPANASAHRFLSDSYQGVRRREISRVSELMQAQLLQDVNLNPIQPSLAETNVNAITLGGPASPGFNEFTPLFESNGVRFNSAGFAGSNSTFGGEGALSALHNGLSFGAGAFHYQSDGWRPNNGLDQQIYQVYAQAAVTPELNVQAEYRRRVSTEGDLAFNFDLDATEKDRTVDRQQDTTRLGLRYAPTPGSSWLLSYIHSDRSQRQRSGSVPIDPSTTATATLHDDQSGDQGEGQYIGQFERFNLVAGFGYSSVDQSSSGTVTFYDLTLPEPLVTQDEFSGKVQHARGYLYSHLALPASVTATLGFSYDDYRDTLVQRASFNPKFGLRWDPTPDLRLRAAAFRVLKPALVNNRTIEPTQIAGFNQFYDDGDATRYWRYAGGLDWRVRGDLFLGGEISWRSLDEPMVTLDQEGRELPVAEGRREQFHSVYAYWTPTDSLGLRAEFQYDRFDSQLGAATESGGVPVSVETFMVPLSLSYFHSSGWFARVGSSFVHQQVVRQAGFPGGRGNDSFCLVDADLGYRLPKRLGTVSVGVKNLFNTQFRYQDDSFREFRDEPAIGPYFPDRIVMGRIVLNF